MASVALRASSSGVRLGVCLQRVGGLCVFERSASSDSVTCRSFSASAASSGAPAAAAAPAPAAPAYTISELPTPTTAVAAARALGRVRNVRGHSKKLDSLARQVRLLSVNEALAQMAFSARARANDVRKALLRASREAEVYHGLTKSKLMVEAAWTGKHQSSPRIRHHSKMRAGRSHKRTSQLTLRVREMTAAEAEKKNKFKNLPTKESIAKLSPRGY